MVESGGGNGMAINVVTAIRADITAVKAAFFDGEIFVVDFIFEFMFSLRQYYLVQVLRVDSDSAVLSARSQSQLPET
jgi:small basic protein